MAYLAKSRQNWIDSVITNVKSSTDDEYYPLVSLAEMARSLGIKVFEDDLTPISGSLSGFITYDDPAKKTNPRIFIEKSMNPERKRFTLAHELGHHFLHEGIKLRLDNLDYSASDKNTTEETEANYFAASLLIPKELLLPKLENNVSVSELADYFKVSLSAMKNRIKWIKAN
jgi:Zn-dependent peptidase ImmA (M78 family)